MKAPPKVQILFTEAGGGHKSVALALGATLERQLSWSVRLVNPYRDIGDRGVFPFPTSRSGENAYNSLLKHVIPTYAPFQAFYPCALLVRTSKALGRTSTIRALVPYWQRHAPDLVVSVTPWINDLLADSLALALPGVPLVTVMTDYDECARGMWLSSPRQVLVCPTDRAAQRARRRGHSGDRIHTVSGLVVAPPFYDRAPIDRNAELTTLGLQHHVPTGLVMFGRQGATNMLGVARAMTKASYPVQLVFICGDNPRLTRQLERLATPYRKVVRGLVTDVARYMALADFFIGKPGPSSIAEALASGLPMVLEYGWRTMLQERFNAAWVCEKGAGLPVARTADVPRTVHALLNRYDHHRAAARALSRGNAVMEVAHLLARQVATARAVCV